MRVTKREAAVGAVAALAGFGAACVLRKTPQLAHAAPSVKKSEKPEAPKKDAKHKFAGMNRPYAGARTLKKLPEGDKTYQLYSLGTPNGAKVSVALEEMKLPYDAHTIQIMELDQFTSGFTNICPNGKIPAMVDKEGPDGKSIRVFESGAILLYLAEKTGQFIPAVGTAARAECLNWLFFQMGGLGPMFGQFGHFYKYAAEKLPYPIERYSMEAKRLLDVLDRQLEGNQYMIGDEYTIADMSIFPWVRCLGPKGYNAEEYLRTAFGRDDAYPNIQSWMERCMARPAVEAGLKINLFTDKSCIGSEKGTPIDNSQSRN